MIKKTLACAIVVALAGCGESTPKNTEQTVKTAEVKAAVNYPETKKGTVVDEYFGAKVADPYRWLEDDMSDETAQWVKAENDVTFSYLKNIPYRASSSHDLIGSSP